MKWLLSIVLVVATTYIIECSPPKDKLDEIIEECSNEAGVADEFRLLPMDNPKMKYFLACILNKKGFLIDGKISLENMAESMHERISNEEKLQEMLEKVTHCVSKANKETNGTEVAYVLFECSESGSDFPQ